MYTSGGEARRRLECDCRRGGARSKLQLSSRSADNPENRSALGGSTQGEERRGGGRGGVGGVREGE